MAPPGFGQFLSTRGTTLSHKELSRKVKQYEEVEEEKKRGTQLSNPGHLRVNQDLVDVQSSWVRVQSALDGYHGEGNVPGTIQAAMDQGERQLMLARQGLRIIESHGPKLAAQFCGDPLLTTEDTARLLSLVKDQNDKNAVRGSGGGGRTPGVQRGKVGGAPRALAKKQGASGKSVSGSSQLIASSVSSGLVSNVARMGTSRKTARSPSGFKSMHPAVVVPSGCILPPALQAGVSAYFNYKITDIQLLDKFEGGMVSEDDDGLAIMFEADSEIESKLTGTLKSHVSAWEHIGAGEFALSVIKNGYIPKLGAMPTFYAEQNNKSYHENVDFANDAVMKLLNAGVVEEVHRSSLRCVNPLTVAQNTAKKRLCIDLSRCFNMQCKAQKFKI